MEVQIPHPVALHEEAELGCLRPLAYKGEGTGTPKTNHRFYDAKIKTVAPQCWMARSWANLSGLGGKT